MRANQTIKRILLYAAGLVIFIFIAVIILNYSSIGLPLDVGSLLPEQVHATQSAFKDGACSPKKTCPAGALSFSISSGAANVIAPKICVQNELVLSGVKNNAGSGINVVVVNGRTPEVLKAKAFNMYSQEIQPLIELLQGLEKGNIVLMTTFDEPATKLTDEARTLIESLGSTLIKSVGYRDNWVFVGGKGDIMKSLYEKHIKSEAEKNAYDGWPEMLQLDGCVPLYVG